MGTLYVIATPIGNLKDISIRAIEVLKEVEFIICEDTRRSLKLLNHYEIRKKLESFNTYNRNKKLDMLISKLQESDGALITDGGTPCISDPGAILTDKAYENDIKVEPIPGATAFVSLLSVCGLNVKEFTFYGFLSNKKARRKNELTRIKENQSILIFYESPYRIRNFLLTAYEIFGDIKIILGRELTKKFEQIIRNNLYEIINNLENIKEKGEYTIILDNRQKK